MRVKGLGAFELKGWMGCTRTPSFTLASIMSRQFDTYVIRPIVLKRVFPRVSRQHKKGGGGWGGGGGYFNVSRAVVSRVRSMGTILITLLQTPYSCP